MAWSREHGIRLSPLSSVKRDQSPYSGSSCVENSKKKECRCDGLKLPGHRRLRMDVTSVTDTYTNHPPIRSNGCDVLVVLRRTVKKRLRLMLATSYRVRHVCQLGVHLQLNIRILSSSTRPKSQQASICPTTRCLTRTTPGGKRTSGVRY